MIESHMNFANMLFSFSLITSGFTKNLHSEQFAKLTHLNRPLGY